MMLFWKRFPRKNRLETPIAERDGCTKCGWGASRPTEDEPAVSRRDVADPPRSFGAAALGL